MRDYLSDLPDGGSHRNSAVALRFFQTCLKPSLGDRMTFRTEKEMGLLAEAVGLLVAGRVVEAAELLLQRFKALISRN